MGVVISIYGTLSGEMLGAPRVFFAVVVCAFALSCTFRYLAVFATGALLLIYLGVSLAVLRLRQRDGLPGAGEFRLPFGPIIPLSSCLIVGWLLLQVPTGEALSIAGLIGASVVVYAVRAMVRRSKTAETSS